MAESLLPTYEIIDVGALILLTFIILAMLWRVRSGALELPHLARRQTSETVPGSSIGRGDYLKSLVSVLLVDVGTSRPLMSCDRVKWSSHVLIFWGFVFTAIATTLAYFMKPEGAILPLMHPVKLFGNSGGILLAGGCSAMFYSRYQESGSMWNLHRSDYFLVSLLLATVSGFATENSIYVFGRTGTVTAVTYWMHIAIIISLLATAPFTKFVHSFYKPSWALYQRLETRLESLRERKTM